MTEGERPRPVVVIYTDGGCKPNPGPGGWGAILRCPEKRLEKELSGCEPDTTNNRMELTAVIRALEVLRMPCSVTIVTDSEYLANAFREGWLENWKANGWRTRSKAPVKNQDLWMALDSLLERHVAHWQWVRGHSGHRENERCDQLATLARERGFQGGRNRTHR